MLNLLRVTSWNDMAWCGKKGETVVCTLTGNGLKDLGTVFKVAKEPMKVYGG